MFLTNYTYASDGIPNFSYLYEHPNSHYFFTCGAGKISLFNNDLLILLPGYIPGKDVYIAIDAAASEFYNENENVLS